MGVVYRAEDTKLGRSVALKFLPDDLLHDREARDRFRREARLASTLNHLNICTIHDVEETEGRPFLVLELLEGRSLKARLSEGRLDEAEVLEIGKQVASALAAAHDKGVLHRDVKPANIFIGPGGHVKLLDFGLAKFAHPLARVANVQHDSAADTLTAPEHLTRSGATLGTVSYMSPEQALGEKVDARSDLFSLGVVFYEMVTAKLSEGLHGLILKALEKQPGARFQSAADLDLAVEHLKEPAHAASARTTWLSNKTGGWLLVAAAAAGALVFSMLGRGAREGDDFTSNVTLGQFTAWPGVESEPSFSPDGNDIAFASSASGNFDIYVQRVGGQNPANLTADSSFDDTQPVFSPDGQHIAFRSERDGGGIFVMGATGESPRRVVDAGYYRDWSPDGSRIVYASETFLHPGLRARGSRLFVLDLATEDMREIAVNDAVQPNRLPTRHPTANGSRSLAEAPRDSPT